MTAANPARRGSIIAAIWLIGLGLVFLVRGAANLSWSQAWPLFLILVGVASFVSVALDLTQRGPGGVWAFTWPIIWIAIGVVLLLSTTGTLPQGPIEVILEWWPWLAVGVGAWFLVGALVPSGRVRQENLEVPLGAATSANVRIRFGAGTLETRRAAAGRLVDGFLAGGGRTRSMGDGRIELEQDTSQGWPWLDHRSAWTLGLTGEVPLELRLDTGANRSVLDLSDLQLERLELHTGASDTRIVVPRSAGESSMRLEAGAAQLTIEVPEGVAARIRTRVVFGSVVVDESRFPAVSGGYESPDFGTATNRVDIEVQGGIGSLRIRSAS